MVHIAYVVVAAVWIVHSHYESADGAPSNPTFDGLFRYSKDVIFQADTYPTKNPSTRGHIFYGIKYGNAKRFEVRPTLEPQTGPRAREPNYIWFHISRNP